jgi:Tfp pilus assembly protein PilW
MVELMVALVIGSIVVAGLIDLFVSNRQAYQVQSGNDFLQENLRTATDRIGWSIRMADYWGGTKAANIANGAGGTVTAKGACNGAWATAVQSNTTGGGGIFGYDGAGTFPIDAACIDGAANYVPMSDVLVLRYADSQTLSPGPADATTPAESTTISGNPSAVFLLSTPGISAQLFAGTVPTTSTPNLQRYVQALDVDMYYLRPCSVIATGSTCQATDDGGTPLPTLMRTYLKPDGTLVSEPIVQGIEQIKFEYGIPGDATTNAPTYKSAADITASNLWGSVVSVRLSLVSVSPVRDLTIPHTGLFTLGTDGKCGYTINNGSADTTNCAGFTPFGDKPWQFTRTQQQLVMQLRNRVRG